MLTAEFRLMPPDRFVLGEKGCLAVVSTNGQDRGYSKHMAFTDRSTLFSDRSTLLKKHLELKEKCKLAVVGTGNGWEINNAITNCAMKFFDASLKEDKITTELENYTPLIMHHGRGTFIASQHFWQAVVPSIVTKEIAQEEDIARRKEYEDGFTA